MLVGVGELVGADLDCAAGVEEDDNDAVVEEEEEEEEEVEEEVEVVEEDDALPVKLKYPDVNRGPLISFEALYIPSQKTLLRDRFWLFFGTAVHV